MKFKPWILAARPKTLPAAACPVLAGSLLAFSENAFVWIPAMVAVLFAFLVQIGTNFANDYFDFKKGADTPQRKGPARAVASGWISPKSMLRATIGVLALAFCVGLTLIPFGGWMTLAVGLISIACAFAYTGGPYPLAYKGLGDVFVVIFFGFVAVGFTFYVQAGYFSPLGWTIGLAQGLLINNLLVINNIRDIEEDRKSHKMTLPARFGRTFGLIQYQASITIACLIALGIALATDQAAYFLPAMTYPVGRYLGIMTMKAVDPAAYNRVLALTSGYLILYTTMLAAGALLF
ncbi:MAG: 1,4-dihydroxy-2-naphthoate polyprenyltransferase [Verrucomicrobiota bacterium]